MKLQFLTHSCQPNRLYFPYYDYDYLLVNKHYKMYNYVFILQLMYLLMLVTKKIRKARTELTWMIHNLLFLT
jgi:hypothetical protein